MGDILTQLRELLLGSVPTAVFFLIILFAYQVLVRRPLENVLRERHGRTGGAMDEAKAAIAAAGDRTAEYERRLRDARTEIFNRRAEREKTAAAARDKALAEAREAAQHRIAVAREGVQRAGEQARAGIEQGAASLTDSILAAILPNRTGAAQ